MFGLFVYCCKTKEENLISWTSCTFGCIAREVILLKNIQFGAGQSSARAARW